MVQMAVLWNELLEEFAEDLISFARPGKDFQDQEEGLRFSEPVLDGGRDEAPVVDKVIEISRKDGGREYLLAHVEELADEYLPERVFQMFGRLLVEKNDPVWVLAVMVDPKNVRGAGRLDRFSRKGVLGDGVELEYSLLRVADFSDAELWESDNPFALVLLAAKKGLLKGRVTEGELLAEKEKVADAVRRKEGLGERKRELLLRFVEEKMGLEKEKGYREGRVN